ncbi:hypothetical protein FA15DRAFT_646372 [Coprinopsis marcescibilis]|uniref:BTB domain-containing protein n=1 Tax=Coprinopsis marcescibilis TaxID=230819 RepID=A0A5C3KL99_COPMA|nr:hypothetical protein FA15DRAFT_646372 [Coprinopsis marcescibilis]
MALQDDFSTNQNHASTILPAQHSSSYQKHPLSFEDGNLALLVENYFFIVHKGLICRHSAPLEKLIKDSTDKRRLLNRPVVEVKEKWADLGCFLSSMYDGVTHLSASIEDFAVVAAILRLATKYQVAHIRIEILRKLASTWSRNLLAWDIRESNATTLGLYKPRAVYPHPIMVIPLFYEVKAFEFLPSAFYDLSRCLASDILSGWSYPADPSTSWYLNNEAILTVLKGKEQASRFLSTFIVNELEGREPCASCVYKSDPDPMKKRICPASFEAVTFEIVRDCNGVVCHRVTDPLFAILDSYLMQKRDNPIGRGKITFRACDYCRDEFAHAVESARNDLWQKLPAWFGVKLEHWPQNAGY